jgi:phytoene dehydrogenase-like protein
VAARSYKQTQPQGRWDAIVIGSGIGGLTTAALLAHHAGKRVLVLEQHYTTGGFTQIFKRPGYEWDTGLHYVGEMGGESDLLGIVDTVTGGEVQWARMPECYDRVVMGERSFDLLASRERFVEGLVAHFPKERQTIRDYLALAQQASKRAISFFFDRMLPGPLSATFGALARRRFARFADRTVEEVLRPRISDPVLFDVLTAQLGDYGHTPREASFAVHAMVASHFVDGGYYPVGGPATLARAACNVIERSGGEVYTNAKVDRILIERGRAIGVRMDDGSELTAPFVISDAGVPNTYLRLVPKDVAERTGLPARIRAVGPSSAHFCLHLGFRHTDRELGLDGTNLWIYPERDRDAAFARFAADPEAPLPLAYVSFPSAKDPSFAARHPGRATVVVITLAKMEHVRRWAESRWMKRGDAYEAFKRSMSERMLDAIDRQLPQLRGKIDHQELSTPLSTRFFTGHDDGEMYGMAHTPARFRLPLRAKTSIPGLYLTGADLAACGVAGAIIGGTVCAAAVAQRDLASVMRTHMRMRRTAPALPAPARAA